MVLTPLRGKRRGRGMFLYKDKVLRSKKNLGMIRSLRMKPSKARTEEGGEAKEERPN